MVGESITPTIDRHINLEAAGQAFEFSAHREALKYCRTGDPYSWACCARLYYIMSAAHTPAVVMDKYVTSKLTTLMLTIAQRHWFF